MLHDYAFTTMLFYDHAYRLSCMLSLAFNSVLSLRPCCFFNKYSTMQLQLPSIYPSPNSASIVWYIVLDISFHACLSSICHCSILHQLIADQFIPHHSCVRHSVINTIQYYTSTTVDLLPFYSLSFNFSILHCPLLLRVMILLLLYYCLHIRPAYFNSLQFMPSVLYFNRSSKWPSVVC